MLAAGYGYGGPHLLSSSRSEATGWRLTMRRPDGTVLDRMALTKAQAAPTRRR